MNHHHELYFNTGQKSQQYYLIKWWCWLAKHMTIQIPLSVSSGDALFCYQTWTTIVVCLTKTKAFLFSKLMYCTCIRQLHAKNNSVNDNSMETLLNYQFSRLFNEWEFPSMSRQGFLKYHIKALLSITDHSLVEKNPIQSPNLLHICAT
jgi:ABC-type transport system involved in Fe-S cluster assembly fused permease/ATPase subunit